MELFLISQFTLEKEGLHFVLITWAASITNSSKSLWLTTVEAAAKSLQSCPTLCDPVEGSPPGSPVPGILQARFRNGLPFPSPMHPCMQSLQSCPILCDPMDSSPPGSSVHGILQTRTLEWVAISFSHNRGYFPAYLTVGLEGIRLRMCMSFCMVFQTPFTLSFWKSLGPSRSSLLDHLYPAGRRQYKKPNCITTTLVQKRFRLVNT